jgi:hypothetical protein
MISVERQSETYSHMGNISAQGVQRLLGTPTIDRLQTVIRESVQNSWDAGNEKGRPTFTVNLRSLTDDEIDFLRSQFFADFVPEDSASCLSHFLSAANPMVLELADFGTSGLGGPTDASVITDDDDDTDFVDFIRNIGTPRNTVFGGGTYGYGKSSLYNLSRCGTIIVDTLTSFKGKTERRVMGCRVAESFVVKAGRHRGKYTGRHWWGHATNADRLDPIKGRKAERIANSLGAFDRGNDDLGTSILILDPDIEETPEQTINSIQRSLLWNFWPKMVNYEGQGPSMHFSTYLNGQEVALPSPRECPPLDLFETAMKRLKRGDATSIDSRRPAAHLGLIALEKGIRGKRRQGFGPADDGMFPENSYHVALMRPAELVVKYLTGNPLPPGAEWGGLFLCSTEPEVEQAFAQAEPPAHDDWIPKHMSNRRLKTFVNVALRKIRAEMEQSVAPQGITGADTGGAELAGLSGAMGALLDGAIGDGLTIDKPRRRKTGKSTPRRLRITDLQPWGPDEWEDGEVLAWFTFSVQSPDVRDITLTGRPRVFIDGELSELSPGGLKPEIRVWADKDEKLLAEGSSLSISTDDASLIWVGISIPENVALSFTPEIIL